MLTACVANIYIFATLNKKNTDLLYTP